MVVPEELKDAKSQFRVLKEIFNACFGTVANVTGKFKVAASTTFYLMVNQSANQVGKEVGFTKNFER
jgi:hypothetical protein